MHKKEHNIFALLLRFPYIPTSIRENNKPKTPDKSSKMHYKIGRHSHMRIVNRKNIKMTYRFITPRE